MKILRSQSQSENSEGTRADAIIQLHSFQTVQSVQVCSDISDFPYVQTLQFLNSKGTDSMTNDQ